MDNDWQWLTSMDNFLVDPFVASKVFWTCFYKNYKSLSHSDLPSLLLTDGFLKDYVTPL